MPKFIACKQIHNNNEIIINTNMIESIVNLGVYTRVILPDGVNYDVNMSYHDFIVATVASDWRNSND